MPSDRAWSTERSSVSSPLMTRRPSSGFWKPEMILISVDLPAPLSPSRPSTSPLPRCRLTSRSAVTGPKRLATCSTTRTSSAGTAAPLSHTPDVHIDDHRDKDREAEEKAQVARLAPRGRQPVAREAEKQRPKKPPPRRTLPAGQQRAADDRRRHGAEHRL